jgi:putative hydrolase of the HAD superfamily
MPGTLEIIGFDADDTLWHNETLYARSQEKFARLLSPYHEPAWIAQRLYATEMRNLKQFGYGIKGFTLSMIETAIELTEGRIQGHEIQAIIDLAREMLQAPVDLLPGVQPVLERLSRRYPLLLITKGDLFDQTTKIARSGLADYFQQVEVVPEKDEGTYRQILRRQGIAPERFLMVGNSLRSAG